MFRCENEHCGIVVHPRQPVNRIVLERRERTYEVVRKRGKNKGKVETVHGWEIVKELKVCPKCYRTLTGKAPKIVEEVKKPQFENKPRRKFDKKFDKNKKKPWQNPERKKNQQQTKNTSKRNTDKKDTPKRKTPIVEVINPIKIVKE